MFIDASSTTMLMSSTVLTSANNGQLEPTVDTKLSSHTQNPITEFSTHESIPDYTTHTITTTNNYSTNTPTKITSSTLKPTTDDLTTIYHHQTTTTEPKPPKKKHIWWKILIALLVVSTISGLGYYLFTRYKDSSIQYARLNF